MENQNCQILSLAKEISNRVTQMEQEIDGPVNYNLKNNNNFLDGENRERIEKCLRELNESIAKMSQLCVDRIDELEKKSESLESGIFEVDGLLNIMKDKIGTTSLNNYLDENQKGTHKIDGTKSVISPIEYDFSFDYSGEGYQINTNYLENVGDQIGQMKNEYLINEIPETQKAPQYWMSFNDYFIKAEE